MRFRPKVSIVIPVFNGTNYLAEAVESAVGQTYDNYEIVIVNDGSRDQGKTTALAKRLREAHPELIRYFEKENGGVASALNLGLREMKGEYFSWLSHDDLYAPEKLAAQVEAFAGLSDQARRRTMVYSDFNVIGMRGEAIGSVRLGERHSTENLNRSLYPLVNGLIHGCSLLIPTEVLRAEGGFDEDLRYTQDYALWLQLLKTMSIRHISRCLISSRQHAEQDSLRVSIRDRRQMEEDALWTKIFDAVTPEMRLAFEESEHVFFAKLLALLNPERMPEAHKYVAKNWIEQISSSMQAQCPLVLVVVVEAKAKAKAAATLFAESIESVRAQKYSNCEVLVIDARRSALEIREGIEKYRPDYVAFLRPGDRFHSLKIAAQVWFMVKSNCDFAQTSFVQNDCFFDADGICPQRFVNWSTYMLKAERLSEFLENDFNDLRTLFWRISRKIPVANLNLPLAWILEDAAHFKVRWSDVTAMEKMTLAQRKARDLGRRLRHRAYRLFKNGVFDRMPFRVQLEIRRFLANR